MSKTNPMNASPSNPYAPPSPVLPCPTSPLQQTESESWEHEREGTRGPGYPSSYDRYVNDHITDRVSSEEALETDD